MSLRSGIAIFPAMAALALLAGCDFATHNQAKLKAIRAESRLLMATHPIRPAEDWADVPKGQWPPVIASLRPETVTVHHWGVDIWIKPYFDGGWGYHVPRNARDLPMPAGCYSEPGQGVFWHGPC